MISSVHLDARWAGAHDLSAIASRRLVGDGGKRYTVRPFVEERGVHHGQPTETQLPRRLPCIAWPQCFMDASGGRVYGWEHHCPPSPACDG